MKKIAILLTVLMLFSFAFAACSKAPATEETTTEETTIAPAVNETEAENQEVIATADSTEATSENTDESIFYVG